MRLLYLDEAGISDREPYLVVAGAALHADSQLIAVRAALDALVREWIPSESQGGFVFHATELFNGGGKVFKRRHGDWPMERRLALADRLSALPQQLGLRLAVGVLCKADHSMQNPNRETRAIMHAIAFLGCVATLESWMRDNHPDEVCMVIAEDNEQARGAIRDFMRTAQDAGIVSRLANHWSHFLPLTHIHEDPLFQPKKSSSVLQIADFVAYVVRKHYEGDERFRRFSEPLWPALLPAVFPDRPLPV